MASHPRSTKRTTREMLLLSFLMIFTVVLAACGSQQANGPHKQVPLSIVGNTGGDFTRIFNPYNPNTNYGAQGMTYETLLFFNRLDGTVKPWLAQSYDFSSDATQITFHLRSGVKWSDGQPFSSDDVLFTLNELKKYPGMDVFSMWQFIKSVSAPDASTITVTLNTHFSPILWYLGGQTWILPQHHYASVGDGSQYADPNPVGTGPYLLKSFTPQIYTMVKNPHYWQPGKPTVNEITFPAFNSNTSAELALNRGDIQWTGLYIPNLQQTYINRDPQHNHYWFPPSDVVMLYVNTAKYPFNLLPVRQAISNALDRTQLDKIAESGYEPVASPTGLLLPQDKSYLAPDYANLSFSQNTAQAQQLLQSAGFTKGSDGFYADKNGKKLSFSIDVVSGWTDWITSCQIMASELKAAGMNVTVNSMSYDAYYSALQMGGFSVAISWTNPGPTPYFIYDGLLRSSNTAPVGQSANSNWERWNDPQTDKLLNQFASTTDASIQQQAIQGIQQIMVNQLPSIPLTNEPYWYEYNSTHYTGWPDPSHAYAVPSPFISPDNEIVLLNLQPV
ncbi:MAG TPA: ABC transporter substrate-binding protein [Ktedonobacteraceae bacterium]|nr:ABC transporter substrate-binding protein [Ktedonobacteraceae bacterium]